jgi:hypothetical protein
MALVVGCLSLLGFLGSDLKPPRLISPGILVAGFNVRYQVKRGKCVKV